MEHDWRSAQKEPIILQVDLEIDDLPEEYVYIHPNSDSPKDFCPIFQAAMQEVSNTDAPVEQIDHALSLIRERFHLTPDCCKRLVPGVRVAIAPEPGSALRGATGTILGRERFFGTDAFRVKFDVPVVYPSGNPVESDIIFMHEIRTLPTIKHDSFKL